MLQVSEVTKWFSQTAFALNKISFSLGNGLHVIVGPNGAGKTTLLRIVATVLRPDGGTVLYNGQDVYSNLLGYKLGLGYLPQTLGFYDHMTGMQFLRYMAGLKGITPRRAQERADYVTDLLGLRHYCKERVSAWSVGLRQRLGLAQALLGNPAVLILDEPFCGLDAEEVEAVSRILGSMSRDRVILVSSHFIKELKINKLLLLVDGNLRFAGLPTALVDEAQGRVWLAEMRKDEWQRMQRRYLASEVIIAGQNSRCKIISREKPDIPGVVPAIPTLEDAYIYMVKDYFGPDGEHRIC